MSPEGVCSLDEYTRTITYDTTNTANTKRRMSITISDGDRMINETSVFINDDNSTINCSISPSPSSSTGLSNATTATCSKNSASVVEPRTEMRRKFNNLYVSGDTDDENGEVLDDFAAKSALNKRRHAINITSNPGYQVSLKNSQFLRPSEPYRGSRGLVSKTSKILNFPAFGKFFKNI